MINNRSVNIPSYQVEVNDLISFNKDITQKIPDVGKAVSIKDLILPFWLERKAVIGKLIAEPNSELIEKQINLRLVIEYFSR